MSERTGESQDNGGTPPEIIAMRAREISAFGEIARTIAYAVGIAVIIRTLIFQPFNIPSGSMIPNLLIGDYLFVSKYAYGYSRYSLPFGPPVMSGRVFGRQPERGDIVVFKWPKDNSTDYIKRVLGLPGDRLQMKGGALYINGDMVARKRVDDFVQPITPNNPCKERRFVEQGADGTALCRIPQYEETLPNGRRYTTLDMGPDRANDDTQEFYVPPGHYFMIGDNRDDSADSRLALARDGVGLVPEANLVGRAEMIFFSTNGKSELWTPWNWVSAIRGERIFNGLRPNDEN